MTQQRSVPQRRRRAFVWDIGEVKLHLPRKRKQTVPAKPSKNQKR